MYVDYRGTATRYLYTKFYGNRCFGRKSVTQNNNWIYNIRTRVDLFLFMTINVAQEPTLHAQGRPSTCIYLQQYKYRHYLLLVSLKYQCGWNLWIYNTYLTALVSQTIATYGQTSREWSNKKDFEERRKQLYSRNKSPKSQHIM